MEPITSSETKTKRFDSIVFTAELWGGVFIGRKFIRCSLHRSLVFMLVVGTTFNANIHERFIMEPFPVEASTQKEEGVSRGL